MGMDEGGLFLVHCKFCNISFQSRKQNVDSHEKGDKHKAKAAAWKQKQTDLAGWQASLLNDQKGIFLDEMQAFVKANSASTEGAAPAPPPPPAQAAAAPPPRAPAPAPQTDRAARAASRAAIAEADANPEAPSSSYSDEEDPISEQATTKQAPTAKEFWEEACHLGERLQYPEWGKLAE
jgi:hypothetical protein